ncbi:MAG: sensor histidine kinase, partial [Anaerovoracaceae bacterium]
GEKLRREFTSNVSHELKTSLTSIYGVSDMLSGDLVKPEDVKGFALTIKEESARLISLIEDIIKLSQLDENTVPDEQEEIDVLGSAEDVARRLRAKADEARVTVNVSGSHVSIMGAETILEEIIYNLCDNAIKYNKEGGTVEISVKQIGDECLLTVKDSGIGIPKSDLKRVFERFYRVDKSHSKATGGTGLGLSIVKHAAAYLGGELDIDSTEGEGTEINIKFKAV